MESFAGELVSGEGASDIDSWEELYGLVMLGKEPQETRMQYPVRHLFQWISSFRNSQGYVCIRQL